MTTDLIKSLSIENLVAQRNAIAAKLRDAAELLAQASDIADQLNAQIDASVTSDHWDKINLESACFDHHERHSLLDDDGPDGAIARVDAKLWDLFLNESGLRSFMDAQAREDWRLQLAELRHPALTVENIDATFESLAKHRGEFFDRGVIALFRKLSWHYKTNTPVKFGKKIIVDWGVSLAFKAGHGHFGYETQNKLDDLVRVFAVADGKPEPDHRDSPFRDQIELRTVHRFDYFELRAFKKGSLHVTFTRPDLVDALNEIIARHHPDALPPAS
jgi:hypothetical protein